jgi:hypothetical protein
MVTTLENLSIYFMDESHRRSIDENPKKTAWKTTSR